MLDTQKTIEALEDRLREGVSEEVHRDIIELLKYFRSLLKNVAE